MSEPLWVDCSSAEEIPSVEVLRELVTDAHHVVLRFPIVLQPIVKASLVQRLASALPEFTVFDSGGSHDTERFTVKKVIAAEDVRVYEKEFLAALRLFRQTASMLAIRLAGRLGVSTDRLSDLGPGIYRRGWADWLRGLWGRGIRGNRLDRERTYCFHGRQCRFENHVTGQVVEVRLGFGTEFGVLDPYFFALFVKTTPELAHLARLLPDNFHDVARVFELLHRAGHLRVVEQGCQSGMAVREAEGQQGEHIPVDTPGADFMPEADWNSCAEPTVMLRFLGGRASERKLRFLCCGCCRRLWHLLEAENLRQAVDALERFADGEMDEMTFRAVANTTHPLRAYYDELLSGPVRGERWLAAYGINRVVQGELVTRGQTVISALRPRIEDIGKALDFFARAITAADNGSRDGEQSCAPSATESATQADLIREIFGDPFRIMPVIDSAWLAWNDGTVKHLAEAAYEHRSLPDGTLDLGRLAVLADALEEAGCTDAELLGHLRAEGPHLRGCFAVDAVLGKS